MRAWLLVLWLCLAPLLSQAQTACTADQWCKVFDNSWSSPTNGTPQYKQNGWNKAIFSHDVDRIYIGGQGNQTTDGTLCNPTTPTLPCSSQLNLTTTNSPYSNDTFFTHPSISANQPTLYVSPPYTEFYSSAITENAPLYPQQGAHLWLATTPHDGNLEHRPLTATDGQITLCSKNAACTGPAQIDALPATGTMFLDDEVFDYSACTAYGADLVTPLADCQRQAYKYVLTVASDCPKPLGSNLCRGQRTGASWMAATTHNVNDSTHPTEGWAWLTTPKVFNDDGTVRYGARINTSSSLNTLSLAYGDNQASTEFDGPTSRHQRGVLNYDPVRGKIWYFMGFQEMTSNLKDLWWKCIYAPAGGPSGSGTFSDACGSGDLTKGWQHANLATAGHSYPTSPGSPPCCFTESDTIYLPAPFDALVHFGGLLSGAHSDLNIMCLSDTSVPVKLCHTDGDISNAASYVARQFFSLPDTTAVQGVNGAAVNGFATCNTTSNPNCHGQPGLRDGPTLSYDPTSEHMLIVGGKTSTSACPTNSVCWTSIAHWNPRTDDYCLSDTSQNGRVIGGATYYEFNGAGCNTTNSGLKQVPLANTGAAPFTESTSLYFPAAAWNNNASVNKLMLVKADEASASTSGIYFYDPTANTWTRSSVVGGPPPHTTNNAIYQAGLSLVHDDVHSMNWLVEAHSGLNIGIWELADSALTGTPPTPTYNLTVYLAGTGSGAVLDSPQTYINCGTQCSHTYTGGTAVTLTAQPNGSSTFAGWSGACSGTGDCVLTMDADQNVTATFNPPAVAGATTYSGMTIGGMEVQ